MTTDTMTYVLAEKVRSYRGCLRKHDPAKAAAVVIRRTRSLLERRRDIAYTVPQIEVEHDHARREIRGYAFWSEAALPKGSGSYVLPSEAPRNIKLPR